MSFLILWQVPAVGHTNVATNAIAPPRRPDPLLARSKLSARRLACLPDAIVRISFVEDVRCRPRLCENANVRLRLIKICSNQGA
jgi:hypothetical protein